MNDELKKLQAFVAKLEQRKFETLPPVEKIRLANLISEGWKYIGLLTLERMRTV